MMVTEQLYWAEFFESDIKRLLSFICYSFVDHWEVVNWVVPPLRSRITSSNRDGSQPFNAVKLYKDIVNDLSLLGL